MKIDIDLENTIYQGEGTHNVHNHQQHDIDLEMKPSEEVLVEVNDLMTQKTQEIQTDDILLNTGEKTYLVTITIIIPCKPSGLEKRMVHDHVHGEPNHVHSNDQQNDMMDTGDGRKLSRKFSGIADILERKIKAGTKYCD